MERKEMCNYIDTYIDTFYSAQSHEKYYFYFPEKKAKV